MIVYACGYLVGSLLVERLDEAPVLTWAVIRTVAGLLLSTIGFLLSLVLSLPWFLVPGTLVAATVYFRGRRAFRGRMGLSGSSGTASQQESWLSSWCTDHDHVVLHGSRRLPTSVLQRRHVILS